ncbi:PAS domain S-box protein, partial [Maribacter arcticus]|uniref:PAS domain S-box protein n=1 Tax=Maribacter arcticus TaxID=561365 RepID=UPI0030021660
MMTQQRDPALLQSIFDSSIEGILVVDDQGTILDANASCERIFGYGEGELLQKNLEILLPEKFRKKHKTHTSNYTKKPEARTMGKGMDLKGLKKNGSEFPLDISLSPSTINGAPVTIAYLRDATKRIKDVTEIQKTGRQLSKKEAKNKAILEALPDMILVHDTDGAILDVLSANSSMPYPKEEMIGKNTRNFMPEGEDRDRVLKMLSKVDRTKEMEIIEVEIPLPDGAIVHEVRAVPFERGKVLVVSRNITHSKAVETELKYSEVRNKAILKAIPDLMFVINAKGVYLDVHAPDSSMLVVSEDEIIGKNIDDILPKELCKKIRAAFNSSKKTNKAQIVEYSIPVQETLKYFEARIVANDDGNFLTIIRDVTSQKEAAGTLFIRNRALESATNGIVITDARQPDLPVVYTNDAFAELTGYPKNEIIGRNCRFLQGNDHEQDQIKVMATEIAKGRPSKVVVSNYKKDGTLFWNEVHITPIYNDNEELTHFIGVQNDVTDRKREDFRKDQVRKVLEMITHHASLESVAHKIVETVEDNVKDGMASILLLDAKRQTLHKLAAPNLPKDFSKAIEGVTIGPKVGSCGTAAFLKKEVIVEDIANDSHWVDYKEVALAHDLRACWSFPIVSSDKKVLGTFAIYSKEPRKPLENEKEIIIDMVKLAGIAIAQHNTGISLQNKNQQLEEHAQKLEEKVAERTNELKAMVQQLVASNLDLRDQVEITQKAERKLRASQTMFTAISKNFPRGIITVVDQDYRVLFAAGEGIEIMGLNDFSFEGKLIDEIDVFSAERRSKVKQNVKKTLSGEHLSFEIEFNNTFFSISTTPLLEHDNKITHALIVYSDISQQKKVEQDILNALEKEQELNELKSRFVSMASHEFRTPLSTILSSASLIERQNQPGKEEKRIGYVNRIKSGVKGLVVILNDFLSLSKLEEGKVTAKPEHFNILNFSKDLVEEIEVNKKEKQAIVIDDNCKDAMVYLDSKLVRHILYNLLSNAIKYSPENKDIELSITTTGAQLNIEVRDHGIGIPKEEQKNLFNRFFRANNVASIQGTGLGLHIVKLYTELMKGSISFKSEPN